MKMLQLLQGALAATILAVAPAQAAKPVRDSSPAGTSGTLPGLGITTADPVAHALFETGITAYWAGDAAAALDAFRAAQAADPSCAMCHWGEALALGPRVHAAMPTAHARSAWEAIVHAQPLARNASALERDLIDATRHRYGVSPMVSRRQLDVAWVTAMRQLAGRQPLSKAVHRLLREAEAILRAGAKG